MLALRRNTGLRRARVVRTSRMFGFPAPRNDAVMVQVVKTAVAVAVVAPVAITAVAVVAAAVSTAVVAAAAAASIAVVDAVAAVAHNVNTASSTAG